MKKEEIMNVDKKSPREKREEELMKRILNRLNITSLYRENIALRAFSVKTTSPHQCYFIGLGDGAFISVGVFREDMQLEKVDMVERYLMPNFIGLIMQSLKPIENSHKNTGNAKLYKGIVIISRNYGKNKELQQISGNYEDIVFLFASAIESLLYKGGHNDNTQ